MMFAVTPIIGEGLIVPCLVERRRAEAERQRAGAHDRRDVVVAVTCDRVCTCKRADFDRVYAAARLVRCGCSDRRWIARARGIDQKTRRIAECLGLFLGEVEHVVEGRVHA